MAQNVRQIKLQYRTMDVNCFRKKKQVNKKKKKKKNPREFHVFCRDTRLMRCKTRIIGRYDVHVLVSYTHTHTYRMRKLMTRPVRSCPLDSWNSLLIQNGRKDLKLVINSNR